MARLGHRGALTATEAGLSCRPRQDLLLCRLSWMLNAGSVAGAVPPSGPNSLTRRLVVKQLRSDTRVGLLPTAEES